MSHPTLSSETIYAAYNKFNSSLSPGLRQKLNGRLERALALVQQGAVELHPMQGKPQGRMYAVNSSDPTRLLPYIVNLSARSCTCMDHWKGHYCKHRIAAQIYESACQIAANPQKVRIETPVPIHQPTTAVCESAPQPLSQPKPQAPTALQSEAIIWAMVKHNGQALAVEVLSLKDDLAVVRALPAVKEGGKLQPQFPFREGKSSITTFPSNDLFHVKVFRRL